MEVLKFFTDIMAQDTDLFVDLFISTVKETVEQNDELYDDIIRLEKTGVVDLTNSEPLYLVIISMLETKKTAATGSSFVKKFDKILIRNIERFETSDYTPVISEIIENMDSLLDQINFDEYIESYIEKRTKKIKLDSSSSL